MELSERKQKILAAIVETYIRTGEPVGSKSLMDVLPMKVSSATIRNEMAELVSLGLLEQPHTSAGRVPSHAGYRYYIDHLMGARELDADSRRKIEAAIGGAGDPEELKELEQRLVSALGEEVDINKIKYNIWKYGHEAFVRWNELVELCGEDLNTEG